MPSSWSSGGGIGGDEDAREFTNAGGGRAVATGVYICRNDGSFWNSVIFSPIGVGGGDECACASAACVCGAYGYAAGSCMGVCVCARGRESDWASAGCGLLRLRRRCFSEGVRLEGGGGEGITRVGRGAEVGANSTAVGVGGSGPTGGGNGLTVFAGGTGEAGIESSCVATATAYALPLDVRRCPNAGGDEGGEDDAGWYSGSSGRGGRVLEGGGFGAPIERRNVRCATELRKDPLPPLGLSSCTGDSLGTEAEGDAPANPDADGDAGAGAGGSADVGAGRGGGMDVRRAATDEGTGAGPDATDAG